MGQAKVGTLMLPTRPVNLCSPPWHRCPAREACSSLSLSCPCVSQLRRNMVETDPCAPSGSASPNSIPDILGLCQPCLYVTTDSEEERCDSHFIMTIGNDCRKLSGRNLDTK